MLQSIVKIEDHRNGPEQVRLAIFDLDASLCQWREPCGLYTTNGLVQQSETVCGCAMTTQPKPLSARSPTNVTHSSTRTLKFIPKK